jgi:RNA polymerase sigma-70 factor, ECF subfamily
MRATMFRHSAGTENEFSPSRHGRSDLESWPDMELLRLCAQRDPAALEEIVRRYQSKLYLFLYRLIGSTEDTEEAVLDVFLRVWQQCGRFEGRASVATWLYRIAVNIALDSKRKKRGRPQTTYLDDDGFNAVSTSSVEDVALHSLELEEQSERLQRALQTLSVGDRTLLTLYYVEELDYDEIREITRCSYPVLKTRLMRARQRLRAAMAPLGAEATS